MKNLTTRKIVRTAVIAALYASLTLIFYFISYGDVQFRVSEALTILPLFCPEAVIGLTLGCFISNIFSPNTLMLDLVLGTLASFVSATMTYVIGRKVKSNARIFLGIIPPILINAIIVPFTFLVMAELKEAYLISFLSVGAGQAAVLILLGIPLYFALRPIRKTLFDKSLF